jgi:exodeoxyribonuclease V alpha subunit
MTAMVARRATGLLADFSAAGVLAVADVQVALRLGELVGEHDDAVLLAVALTVRGTRLGSVMLDLATAAATVSAEAEDAEPVALAWPEAEEWRRRCAGSPLITGDGARPLRMAGARLWLTRYWKQEAFVADDLGSRAAGAPADIGPAALDADLAGLFDDADQRAAARIAITSRLSVIAGGPGTGKTTTIARLLAALLRRQPSTRVALAAPTGKAAARLEEAVHAASDRLTDDDRARLGALSASTLHRLLRRRPGRTSRFVHDRNNRLPFDVVVVDECSMVPLTMMARLLEALPPAARLVLVGDPDQLASVEAGAVLGDLVPGDAEPPAPLRPSVARLTTVHRYAEGGSTDQLARLVRAGRPDEVLELLAAGAPGLTFHAVPDDEPVAGAALEAIRALATHEHAMVAAARAGDESTALDLLDQRRLLCAHRTGPRGERQWSDAIERWLAAADPTLAPRLDGRYAGQPLLVTANDYENGLYNGDTGVVLEQDDGLVAVFRKGRSPFRIPLVRLGEVRPMHAMTVHRAQGSQFASVTVLLPPATSPLATRQTLYTAVTRATANVTVIGSPEAVVACVERPVTRATGLRDRLAPRGS